MAETLDEVLVRLNGDNSGLDRAVDKSKKKFGGLKSVVGGLASVGTKAFIGLGIASVAGIGISIARFATFEQSMASVQAVSGATAEEFEDLSDVAKEMGATTKFTAGESADALSFLAMAGMEAHDMVSALPKVLQLAAAGELELAHAADLVTNVMAGYGLQVEQLGRANDVLVKAATSANTDISQLGQAFKFVGAIAKNAGISFEETTGALALMGNAGLQASMAGTGLRRIISKMLNPTKEAAGILDELGIIAVDDAGEILPLVDIISQFEDAGLGAADALTIFGDRGGPAMLALLEQGSDALKALVVDLENSGGTAERIANTKLDTLSGAFTILKSAIDAVFIEVGSRFAPAMRGMAESITSLTTTALPAIIGFFDSIAGNDVGESLGKLSLVFVGFVSKTVVPAIVHAIPPIIAALGKWTEAILDWFKTAIPAFVRSLGAWASGWYSWIVSQIPGLKNKLAEWGMTIWEWVKTEGPKLPGRFAEWVTGLWSWVADAIPLVIFELKMMVAKIATWINDNQESIKNAAAGMATGLLAWGVTALSLLPGVLDNVLQAILTWLKESAPIVAEEATSQLPGAANSWTKEAAKDAPFELATYEKVVKGSLSGIDFSKEVGEWGPLLLGWIVKSVASVPDSFGIWGTAVVTQLAIWALNFKGLFSEEGIATIGAFLGGIWKVLPEVIGAGVLVFGAFLLGAAGAILKVVEWLFSVAVLILFVAMEIGISIVRGILQGFWMFFGHVFDQIGTAMNKIINEVRRIMGINADTSPSEVFMIIGQALVGGLFNGFTGKNSFIHSCGN